jgi:hypothetical protein
MKLALLLFALAVPAAAQEADGGVPDDLQKELEKAIQADKASAGKADSQKGPPAPEGATSGSAPQTLPRGSQSLNPDISAILDADFGWQRRAPQLLSGDDPNLQAEGMRHAVGFTAQEVELAFSAIVDPYFKGEVYLTIPNLEGIEVEEAFATTTSLPWNLQVKAGSFRSAFGRQNGQHLHVQDFTRRPLINAAFLGQDGMRGPGVQVSWLAPLPFFLTIYVKAFFPLGEAWSLYGGLNFASGKSAGVSLGDLGTKGIGREAQLLAADLYLKWKPANVAQGYASLAFQAEAVLRHFGTGDALQDEWDGGAYAQIVAQFARRWFFGLRGDIVGVPSSSVLARTERVGASLTFQASEFARLRGYVEAEHAPTGLLDTAGAFNTLQPVKPEWAPAVFLQLEISIGAHGAHPF